MPVLSRYGEENLTLRKNHLVHLSPTSFIRANYVQPPQQNFSRTPMSKNLCQARCTRFFGNHALVIRLLLCAFCLARQHVFCVIQRFEEMFGLLKIDLFYAGGEPSGCVTLLQERSTSFFSSGNSFWAHSLYPVP